MNFEKIEITGLRGIAHTQTLTLAIPNGAAGSGLSVVVGPNNSGKSTIFEAFRALAQRSAPSFAEGRRNKATNFNVEIKLTKIGSGSLTLKTVGVGGSETEFISNGLTQPNARCLTLQSRRGFAPYFNKSAWSRGSYIDGINLEARRDMQLPSFAYRLFQIQRNPAEFNSKLKKILGEDLKWNLEMSNQGNHYLKLNFGNDSHDSDGAGEGLLSIFTIVDALYDSSPNDIIYIDEPELSLHPAYQRRMLELLLEYTSDRQIIINTHSPYFISWDALKNGGNISRTVKESTGVKIYTLSQNALNEIYPLVNNRNNPHTLGTDAKEIFFIQDKVVLVEGQEDVVLYNRILKIKQLSLSGDFFGWGVGGADNTSKILKMLQDLGFKKVVVLLDNNKAGLLPALRTDFPNYYFDNIPTDDVRTKPAVAATAAKAEISGLMNESGTAINAQHDGAITTIFTKINNHLNQNN